MTKRRRIRVLLVGDDAFMRDALRNALEDKGFHVLEAPAVKVALNLLRVSVFPLVALIDSNLRNGGADTLVRAIANDPETASRHAYLYIAASPRVIPSHLLCLLQEHDIPILTRPFDTEGLAEAIRVAARRTSNENE